MVKLKVLDPKGVNFGGELFATGKTFTAPLPKSGLVASFLHFKQVEEVQGENGVTEKNDTPAYHATDAAQKLADEYDLDISTVTGTGANGSITKPDVEAAIEAATAQ